MGLKNLIRRDDERSCGFLKSGSGRLWDVLREEHSQQREGPCRLRRVPVAPKAGERKGGVPGCWGLTSFQK